jgi:hypothetical protein
MGYGYSSSVVGTGSTTGGIQNSVAVTFNINNNGVGVYTNGATPSGSDTTVTGVTLASNHALACTLTYDGTTLSLSITDTVTSATSGPYTWTPNIVSDVGATTAYVGFTAGTNYTVSAQSVSNWTYHN